tara:strand:- start:2372 stop:3445 length:1074 start_codon:yes stop_codon:yes gene_type:complete
MANGAFTTFGAGDIINSIDSTTGTLWSGNEPRLTEVYTSSVQNSSNSGQYYIHVYQTSSTETTAAVQFDIAYGDEVGSGSLLYNTLVLGKSPSSTIFGQYQNIALGDDTEPFIFGNYSSSYFYALSFERARYKESLALGTMALSLSGSSGGTGAGAGVTLSLTDNSNISTGNVFGNAGRVYQVVSGSEGTVYTGLNANGYTPDSGSYGLFLPDVGLILLNAAALDGDQPFGTDGGISLGTLRNSNQNDENMSKLYGAISQSVFAGNTFRLNSQETLASDFYFVRAQNADFNYSSNPSFVSGSTGQLLWPQMQNNPQTFITTVGLYNDSNELCAVAKLSRPLAKDFTKELLVRVKLDY